MPLIVDHDQRRATIADIVKRMIAEKGIDAVTVRAVSQAAGYSSTVITHYFRDKAHLLVEAFASVLSESPLRVARRIEAGAPLLDCFEEILPVTPANFRDWQAWFGFWGKVTHDEALAAERLAGLDETQKLLATLLAYGIQRGDLPADLDIAAQGMQLQIFLNGLASMVIMKPEAWPAEAQRAALARQFALMREHPEG